MESYKEKGKAFESLHYSEVLDAVKEAVNVLSVRGLYNDRAAVDAEEVIEYFEEKLKGLSN